MLGLALDYMGRAIEIGSKTAEKKLYTNKQTDRQTDRHYENNGHLAVNQLTRQVNVLQVN